MVKFFLPFIMLTALGSLDSEAVLSKTVSENEIVVEEKNVSSLKEGSSDYFVVAPPTKSVSYGYSNDDFGGGDDPLPDAPDQPSVSGGDYADILQSIDDRLSYFEDLFYYGSTLNEMGDGFKIFVLLLFVLTLNLFLKFMNWR